MSTDIEQRLTAALRAAEAAIGEPAPTPAYIPAEPSADATDRRRRRPRRNAAWLLPVAASVTVLFVVTGSILLVRDTSGSHSSPAVMHHSTLPTVTHPGPGPSTTQQGAAGIDVAAAGLAAGRSGYGYVRAASGLLTTTDYGATWHPATPAGVSPDRLATSDIRLLADGELWLALPSETSTEVSVDLYGRATPSSVWRHTVVRVPSLRPLLGSWASVWLDFSDSGHGWMLAGTQSTPNSGASALLHTADSGRTWTQVAGPDVVPDLGVIRFSQDGTGILVARRTPSSTWITRDAGATWAPLVLAPPPSKRADTATPVGPPVIAGNAILLAASFITPDRTADGAAVYRSVDGATWSVTTVAEPLGTESYLFAGTGSGVSVLLGSSPDSWSTALSIDDGRTYTSRSTAEPGGPLTLSVDNAQHLWVVPGENQCVAGKTQCYSRSPLLSSSDAGRSWTELWPSP